MAENSEYAINTRKSLIVYICICATMFMCVLFGSIGLSHKIAVHGNYTRMIIVLFCSFWLVTFVTQLLMNISIGKQQTSCTSDNSYSGHNAFLITLMPWIFVLGIFMVLLYFIPGLLRIFSNTIGMSIVYDTFKTEINKFISEGQPKALSSENLKAIYIKISNEPQLIINEIEYSDDAQFEGIYSKYELAFPFIFINNDIFKNKIKQLIISKNLIGYGIWIGLIGTIASLISTNAMINVECG
jgi:hypothetical protein